MSRQPKLASNGWTNRYVAESSLEHFVKSKIVKINLQCIIILQIKIKDLTERAVRFNNYSFFLVYLSIIRKCSQF